MLAWVLGLEPGGLEASEQLHGHLRYFVLQALDQISWTCLPSVLLFHPVGSLEGNLGHPVP